MKLRDPRAERQGRAAYLPMGTVADEGPGYTVAAWEMLSPVDVRALALAPAGGPRRAPAVRTAAPDGR